MKLYITPSKLRINTFFKTVTPPNNLCLKNVALIDIIADIVRRIATMVPLFGIPELAKIPEIEQSSKTRNIIIDIALDFVIFKAKPKINIISQVTNGSIISFGNLCKANIICKKKINGKTEQKIMALVKLLISFSADSMSFISLNILSPFFLNSRFGPIKVFLVRDYILFLIWLPHLLLPAYKLQ